MELSTLLFIVTILVFVALFLIGRWLYIRSMRLRNRVQMNYIFTNITHELITPLSIVSALVEQLRNTSPGGKYEYDLMDLNIQRTVRLLQQILEASKSQAGELRLLVSNGDVMQFVSETARSIEPLMSNKGLDFAINCHPESMMGWIDTDKLDKIIFNLLSNAAKYTDEGGHVTLDVTTNRHYDHVIIRVSDDGIGIPKSKMKHLFTRFYDGDYRSSQTFGTGLGLALTRDLVYLHRGTIRCASTEGKGTTFVVDLPINKEAFSRSQIDERHMAKNIAHRTISDVKLTEAVSMSMSVKDVQPVDENASRILIVEDNRELLMLMKRLMQTKYHILTATNGSEALTMVGEKQVDLIVSDVTMPVMDGYELTRHLKQDSAYSHLPIILLTAKTQEEDSDEGLAAGADDVIVKPFKMGTLQLRIDNLIANRQRILRDSGQKVDGSQEDVQDKPLSYDEEFLQRAIRCVNDHLDDGDYSREAFAADMGASTSTLYNKLRALTGKNVTVFIRDMRIKAACRLAQESPDLRVSDIAYRVGYKDPKYFATTFKKVMGQQPKEYFAQLRGEKS
ncbi:MAG: response regulator [Prevotella sp.]|nr:response regulator [Prevotella sp.]